MSDRLDWSAHSFSETRNIPRAETCRSTGPLATLRLIRATCAAPRNDSKHAPRYASSAHDLGEVCGSPIQIMRHSERADRRQTYTPLLLSAGRNGRWFVNDPMPKRLCQPFRDRPGLPE